MRSANLEVPLDLKRAAELNQQAKGSCDRYGFDINWYTKVLVV